MTKEDAEVELQNALIKTYFSNMGFLREIDYILYERVYNLSLAIEQGAYKERFHIEFIQDDGEFDIFDVHYNKYIYNRKPKQYLNKTVNSITFDKKGYLSIFEPAYYSLDLNIDNIEVNKEEILNQEMAALKLCNDMKPFLEILKADILEKKKRYKYIDKMMFIGILLGRHIPLLVKKLKAKHYFIHEPNLELFRLSLFVVDYSALLRYGGSISFSIMDDSTSFENKLYNYYRNNIWENHTIKFHTTDYNVEQSFENVMNALIPAKATLFGYNSMLYTVVKNLAHRINKYPFLYFPIEKSLTVFHQKPVVYVCAGPSLEDNLQWLKKYQNKFIVATIGAAYKTLLSVNITPDIIFTLDGDYAILGKRQFDEESTRKIQDSIVIASCFTHENILKRFNPKRLYLYETMISLKKNSLPLDGHSIGEIGYRILLEMGVSKLYLIGTDLAVHQEKLTSHSSQAQSVTRSYDKNQINSFDKKSFSLNDELIKVKGNILPEVYTTRVLNMSLFDYSKIEKKSWQNVFNLCNHGAFIHNTIPTHVENIDLLQLETFKENQKEFLKTLNKSIKQVSQLKLKEEDLEFLKQISEKVGELKKKIEYFQEKEYQSYEVFKETFIILFRDVLILTESFSNPTMLSIASLFYGAFTPYIEYAFNDSEIKNEKVKIQKTARLWLNNFYIIVEDFQDYLKIAMKK